MTSSATHCAVSCAHRHCCCITSASLHLCVPFITQANALRPCITQPKSAALQVHLQRILGLLCQGMAPQQSYHGRCSAF